VWRDRKYEWKNRRPSLSECVSGRTLNYARAISSGAVDHHARWGRQTMENFLNENLVKLISFLLNVHCISKTI
jgi:hypothetical protein